MTKHIAEAEILSAVPVPPMMTREAKLERWADLISACDFHISLLHNLEKWDEWKLNISLKDLYDNTTAFQIAFDDPLFKSMGLLDTAKSAIDFFNISQDELHEFTCDCGGHISNHAMARHLRNFANPTWGGWIRNWFR